jgi:hypothetical protein
MKTLLTLLCLLGLISNALRADDHSAVVELQAADDERIAAMVAADHGRLDHILSDDLRYTHSTAVIDTKASFVRALDSGVSKYVGVDYEVRDFKVASSDIALMSGRATFRIAPNGTPRSLHLAFLGIWRKEHGAWRFLAWQSCPIPPPTTAK